jgi:hypothetical protein
VKEMFVEGKNIYFQHKYLKRIKTLCLEKASTVSLAELGTLCRVGLRDPMHLCTCVSEEGGDGEDAGSEAPSWGSATMHT